jgi:hypothetical protein
MFPKFLPILIFIFLLFPSLLAAQNDDGIPDNCEYPDAPHYQPNAFIRYDANNQQLELADWSTNQVIRQLESTPEMQKGFGVLSWSPNCRYFLGLVKVPGYLANEMWLWDVVTGSRLQQLEYPRDQSARTYSPRFAWSPDGQQGVFRTKDGFFIWNSSDNSLKLLTHATPQAYLRSPDLSQVFWDYPRNQVIFSGAPGVMIYDLTTGVEKALLLANLSLERWQDTFFALSDDRSLLVAITNQGNRGAGNFEGGLTIWNLDALTSIGINMEGWTVSAPRQVTLSPENRYLVVGLDALRVWDIQNLPEMVEERLPIYRHAGPEALIDSVRFVDWGIVETNSNEGLQRWDLHTGAYIPNT